MGIRRRGEDGFLSNESDDKAGCRVACSTRTTPPLHHCTTAPPGSYVNIGYLTLFCGYFPLAHAWHLLLLLWFLIFVQFILLALLVVNIFKSTVHAQTIFLASCDYICKSSPPPRIHENLRWDASEFATLRQKFSTIYALSVSHEDVILFYYSGRW